MADWLRPTLRRRARMAQPVVAQWRDPAARVYLPPQPCQWGIPAPGERRYHSFIEVGR